MQGTGPGGEPRGDLASPVFVLAAPGVPGQTLAAALGRNPVACDLPETNLELAGMLDALLREMQGLAAVRLHGLLRALAHLLAGEQTMDSVDMARRWLWRRMHLPTGHVARELTALLGSRRMIRPVTSALFDPGAMERLLATYPTARFVHLQMHPRRHGERVMAQAGGAAATLLGARDDSVTPPVTDPQMLWLMADDAVAGLRATIGSDRFHMLRVEDLARDPAGQLARLAQALGLDTGPNPGPNPGRDAGPNPGPNPGPDAVARMCHPELSAFAGPGPFGAHLGGDILSIAALRAAVLPALSAQSLEEAIDATLTGPLPWRPDDGGLRPDVDVRARAVGYR